MHNNLIPCTASQFVRVDIVNSIIASPLNDWNKPWVCIGGPIKKKLKGNLLIFEGPHRVRKVFRGNLQKRQPT
jgi:hypothetical protein